MIRTLCVGPLSTNTYFVTDDSTGDTVIIDPASQADVLERELEQSQFRPVVILLTHGHFDHFCAADALRRHHHIPLGICKAEAQTFSDPQRNLSAPFMGIPLSLDAPDFFFDEGDVLTYGALRFTVLHTPGHTPGSVCFRLEGESPVLFSGDTLFCRSVGRTDFPGGDTATLFASLDRLYALSENMTVYPGHGEATTLATEAKENPFHRATSTQ